MAVLDRDLPGLENDRLYAASRGPRPDIQPNGRTIWSMVTPDKKQAIEMEHMPITGQTESGKATAVTTTVYHRRETISVKNPDPHAVSVLSVSMINREGQQPKYTGAVLSSVLDEGHLGRRIARVRYDENGQRQERLGGYSILPIQESLLHGLPAFEDLPDAIELARTAETLIVHKASVSRAGTIIEFGSPQRSGQELTQIAA